MMHLILKMQYYETLLM